MRDREAATTIEHGAARRGYGGQVVCMAVTPNRWGSATCVRQEIVEQRVGQGKAREQARRAPVRRFPDGRALGLAARRLRL